MGAFVGAFLEAGHAACGFDSNRLQGVTNVDGPTSEDITTATGFRNAVNLVLRIRVGGLATFAPMCGSFNWLCAAQAKRAADNGWLGEAAHPFVAHGNAAAMATALLARVAVLRGVQASVENPPRELHVEHVPSPQSPAGSSAQLPHSSLRLSCLRFNRGRDHEGVQICLHTSVGRQPRPRLHLPAISGPHRHDEKKRMESLGASRL